ncbi:phosphate acetyltransferase, partial [Lactobacillus sp. XV13L]|nr:phosphate acetyltransferase [Lactobacillus sp. XV13L]
GVDVRVLEAAAKLAEEGILKPLLLGDSQQIKAIGKRNNLRLGDVAVGLDTQCPPDEMVQAFIQARGKDIAKADVRAILREPNYYGTMMVKMGQADGMVSGAAHSTAATVRPALQLIHAQEGMRRVSGGFIMERGGKKYVFADCAINLEPDSQTLAEIAYQSVQTARMIGIEPRVAFLSFSTKGSAQGAMVDKVTEAAKLFKQA